MSKRNELTEWREKMAAGEFADPLKAAVALDEIARRRLGALAECYDMASTAGAGQGDWYIAGSCDANANVLRGIVTGLK